MAATDVLTLDRAKDARGYSEADGQYDELLEGFVGYVSSYLDRVCGPIVQRPVVAEFVPSGGGPWLQVDQRPVAAVTAVVLHVAGSSEALTAETPTAAGDYLAERWCVDPAGLLSGRLFYRSSFSPALWPAGTAEVSYTAGRYPSTVDVQGTRFEAAAQILLAWLWHAQSLQATQAGPYDVPYPSFPTEIPGSVRELLAGDVKPEYRAERVA